VKPTYIGPNSVAELRERLGRDLIILPYLKLPGIANLLFSGLVAIALFSRIRFAKRAVIHSKLMNECAEHVKKFVGRSRVSIVCEFEGDFESEIQYARCKGKLAWYHGILQDSVRKMVQRERAVIRSADGLLFVTEKLKEVVLKRQRHTCDKSPQAMGIYPTFASSEIFFFDSGERKRVRRQLGLDGATVLIYSGNLNCAWQIPERISSLYQFIEKELPSAHLVVLTQKGDERYILPSLKEHRVHRYIILHPPHSEIRGYLCAADCGLMLRERHLMNEVASPGKFSEYALSGLPLLMSDGIGEYSLRMKDSEYVLTLEGLEWNPQTRARVVGFVRDRIHCIDRAAYSAWATKSFSIEENLDELLAVYNEVAHRVTPRPSNNIP
jgi:hypothetical protein